MKILGIDPGLAQTGWAILKKNSNQSTSSNSGSIELIKCGCIKTSSDLDLPQRLNILYSGLRNIIKKYKPELIAIEKQFLYQKSQAVLHTSEARGIIFLLAAQKNIKIKEYNPKEVKVAITGYGSADKNQVRFMVKKLLRTENIPRQDDTSDAIAVGICHLNSFLLESTSKIDT